MAFFSCRLLTPGKRRSEEKRDSGRTGKEIFFQTYKTTVTRPTMVVISDSRLARDTHTSICPSASAASPIPTSRTGRRKEQKRRWGRVEG